MKLPSIIVLLIHINSAYEGSCNSGKLTDQENKHRLNTCGIEGLPQPSPDSVGSDVPYLSDTWLCWGQNDPSDESISTASLISPRHLITSSELVLTREMHWRANGRNFDFQEDCRKKERAKNFFLMVFYSGKCILFRHLELPEKHLTGLQFTLHRCYDPTDAKCQGNVLLAKRAYILDICLESGYIQDHFREVFSPMIVEIDYGFNGSTPCLADNRMKIFNGSEADSYGLGRFEEQRYTMKHRKLTIAHTDNLLVFTESYKGEQRRGGPLIQRNPNTSKWTIIGFQASNNMKLSAFFNMKRLQNVLCELIGICPFSNSEIMFSMSSEFPISTSTSSEPTVSNSTSSESLTFTSKASTPITRKPKPSVPSNTKTTINLKLDDSFESIPEELEKDYEENEEKGDDMGIDLYVSRDFFTGGNRGKGEISWEHLVFFSYFVFDFMN
ncbi:Protein CBG13608 [Caenorhabditis briggsae]|uniref:Protein CBG13608 n=1 Tax=Caenorhabditis briggsae TaxID=6238 RepID=A8XIA8_CAEBR|nr:Protein CBG13608 [Caenorhabditis briggsae]CAP32382.1 Protein CBG13608 [Caenorhabditis briggsae]